MEIIIKGEPEEIAGLVLAVQSRQGISPGAYEALKARLFSDSVVEIVQNTETA